MDITLSTSVSTLRTLPFPTTTLHHKSHHFISSITKPNTTSITSNTTNTAKSSSKTATLTTLPHNNNSFISPQQTPTTQNRQTHQNPAVGYAAALLESARRNHALEAVARDVKKMSKWLHRISEGVLTADEKVGFLEGILEKGKFQKLLVKLVRLLVVKNDMRVVFVGQVLSEFQRLFNQLLLTSSSNNTPPPQVVLISPGVKMEESQVAGIARRVQMISGAETVKVRRIVHRRVPSSFAV